MQPRLVRKLGLPYRLFSISLFCAALVCFVVALMRPQYGETIRKISRLSAQVMVCLDVSKSMLAEDAKPNRLERAKAEIGDLLSLMDGDQVGITAFAGKATVACPMTTDFGFLRLILKDIGPHSAGMGGTKLAEPIRLATEGFGEGADISRVILLITDGGDHDSFPKEAAAIAAKRGIRIITVGFGDEAGSRIEITDRRTGETDFVRDSNGEPVVSRLDGDLLRQLALETNGVYIPAGTGALELESIYRQHIVPLTRSQLDSSEEIIRNEAYFIFIAIGIAMLLLSMIVVGLWKPETTRQISSNVGLAAFAITFVTILTAADRGYAQPVIPDATNAQGLDKESATAEVAEETTDPREVYNVAVSRMDTDLDDAHDRFQRARDKAGSDGEVRFRSAFNLGWVEIKRADRLLESDPKQALTHLQTAIDWFNRAIRIRPKDQDARHNLEIVMRRAFELADSLNNKNDEDIAKRIEALIAEQRTLLSDVGQIVEASQSVAEQDLDGERFREPLRKLAVQQRRLLSDANALFDDAATELQTLREEQSDETPPEKLQRGAQLTFAIEYLQKATQRMGQARSQLRLRRQDRAFRRQAVAIEELKRARDVFREPPERIRGLLQDAAPLNAQTLAFAHQTGTVANDQETNPQLPAWLTSELLVEMQSSMTARTNELSEQVAAAVEAMTKPDDETSKAPNVPEAEKQTWKSVAAYLELASTKFANADTQLSADQFEEGAQQQVDAILELQQAEELLLDFRGLIERAFADQSRIHQVLLSVDPTTGEEDFEELTSEIIAFQSNNLKRTTRIVGKLGDELTRVNSASTPQEGQPNASPEQKEKEVAKFRKAIQLAEQVNRELRTTIEAIQSAEPASMPEDDPPSAESSESDDPSPAIPSPFEDATAPSQIAIDKLHELRRLFFTIVQRLQEAAQHQSNINDETQELAVNEEFPLADRGPIGKRQKELQSSADQIADELKEQSVAAANSGNGPASADQQAANDQTAQNFEKAAELVIGSSLDMASSATNLQVETDFELSGTRTIQQSALEKLLAAIELLQPPSDSDDNQDQSQDEQENQEQQPSQDDQQEQPQDNQSNSLLQMVRDKEAQRRDEKAERARRLVPANGPDW